MDDPQRFEYKSIQIESQLVEAQLNTFAKDGWRLASVYAYGSVMVGLILERPVR